MTYTVKVPLLVRFETVRKSTKPKLNLLRLLTDKFPTNSMLVSHAILYAKFLANQGHGRGSFNECFNLG